jgi:hypothetical protein
MNISEVKRTYFKEKNFVFLSFELTLMHMWETKGTGLKQY